MAPTIEEEETSSKEEDDDFEASSKPCSQSIARFTRAATRPDSRNHFDEGQEAPGSSSPEHVSNPASESRPPHHGNFDLEEPHLGDEPEPHLPDAGSAEQRPTKKQRLPSVGYGTPPRKRSYSSKMNTPMSDDDELAATNLDTRSRSRRGSRQRPFTSPHVVSEENSLLHSAWHPREQRLTSALEHGAVPDVETTGLAARGIPRREQPEHRGSGLVKSSTRRPHFAGSLVDSSSVDFMHQMAARFAALDQTELCVADVDESGRLVEVSGTLDPALLGV